RASRSRSSKSSAASLVMVRSRPSSVTTRSPFGRVWTFPLGGVGVLRSAGAFAVAGRRVVVVVFLAVAMVVSSAMGRRWWRWCEPGAGVAIAIPLPLRELGGARGSVPLALLGVRHGRVVGEDEHLPDDLDREGVASDVGVHEL